MTDAESRKPSDEQIIAAIGAWGPDAMTYVVANRLRRGCTDLRTDWVLRQLKRLERLGRVERAPTGYAVQICWRSTEDAAPTKAIEAQSAMIACEHGPQDESAVPQAFAQDLRDL